MAAIHVCAKCTKSKKKNEKKIKRTQRDKVQVHFAIVNAIYSLVTHTHICTSVQAAQRTH